MKVCFSEDLRKEVKNYNINKLTLQLEKWIFLFTTIRSTFMFSRKLYKFNANKTIFLAAIFTIGFIKSAWAIAPFEPFEKITMGAELLKPYTEIEYNGQVFAIENLRGGHNGRNALTASTSLTDIVVAACQTNPPVFDSTTGKWRVPVTNNFIHFEGSDPNLGTFTLGALDDIVNGYLEFANNPTSSDELDFPVNSIFEFQVELELLDFGITLFSEELATVYANDLTSWAPPVGTTYYQDEYIDLVAVSGGPTIARIRPDTTIVTEIVSIPEPSTLFLCTIGVLILSRQKSKPS